MLLLSASLYEIDAPFMPYFVFVLPCMCLAKDSYHSLNVAGLISVDIQLQFFFGWKIWTKVDCRFNYQAIGVQIEIGKFIFWLNFMYCFRG